MSDSVTLLEDSPAEAQKGLIVWFVRNPVAANLLMLLFLVGGILAASNLQRKVFPTVSPNLISVSVPYPGATPAEVEEGITRRVEEAVLGIDGVKRVRSTARENMGSVQIELTDFIDQQVAKDDVQSAVDQIVDFPPKNAERPIVRVPPSIEDVVTLVVLGDVTPKELRLAAEDLERELLSQPSISLVGLAGARTYEISIEVSEETLRDYGLTFADISAAVRANSLDLAGGSIMTESGEILLRTNQKRQTGKDFESIIVRSAADGSQTLLADIAVINDGFSRDKLRNQFNGKPAIFVEVRKANAEDVISIKQEISTFLETYTPPNGIAVIEFRDQTIILRERINLLLRNAIFGFTLVFIFLVLMLDIKLAIWVSAGIGTAFLGAFLFFDYLNVSITMVSLFALIIVLGLVVDDAIVIGENIDTERRGGRSGHEAAIAGVRGVLAPVAVGVMTSIVAFAPILFVTGTMADVGRDIPIVVIIVLFVSMIEAFLILPSHLSHGGIWGTGPIRWIQSRISQKMRDISSGMIEPSVKFAATWRYATAGLAIAFCILCVGLLSSGKVKFIFFPAIEGNDISATVTLPEGTPFDRTEEIVWRMADAARQVAEDAKANDNETLFLSSAVTIGGSKSVDFGPEGGLAFTQAENVGQLQFELVPFGARQTTAAEIERRWREKLGPVEGVERLNFASSLGGFGYDIEFELAHIDDAILIAAVEDLKQRIAPVKGANEIEDSFDLGKRQFVFDLKPAGRAAGLTSADLAVQIRQAFFGEEVQRIQRGRDEIRVYVRYPETARRTLRSLDTFQVRLPSGVGVPLSTVATIEESRAYSSITRIDGRRVVTVTADVDEKLSTPGIANEQIMSNILPEIEAKYPGLSWEQAGASRDQANDISQLGQKFVIALMIIFTLIATQLRSYIQPLAILVSIPIAFAGAVLGHFALGYSLSVVSVFGIVALAGVSVNASVVLVDQYNINRKTGTGAVDAAAAASARRFRPILLTTLTTALGLAPLLTETSPQAQFLIPMAVSLAFGIVISGFMVIYVTPAVTVIIEDIRSLPKRLRRLAGAE